MSRWKWTHLGDPVVPLVKAISAGSSADVSPRHGFESGSPPLKRAVAVIAVY